MEITNETFEAANRRGQAMKARFPAAVAVRYDHHLARVVVSLASGLDLAFSPQDAQGLENATPNDLAGAEISPDGFGIHFPCIDADLYIPALLQGFLGSKRWMAELGKRGGAASSDAKAAAARQNGKLGGRPRKSKGPVTA
jgi:hypothetical protein